MRRNKAIVDKRKSFGVPLQMTEVTAWQSRPLEVMMYPVVFFDALRVKIREEAVVRNKAVYLALGVQADGRLGASGKGLEAGDEPVCHFVRGAL